MAAIVTTTVTTTTTTKEIEYLQSLVSIRERCTYLFNIGVNGENGTGGGGGCSTGLPHFSIHLEALPTVMKLVEECMADSYPKGLAEVPFHSRWRHFELGDATRIERMCLGWENTDSVEKARRLIDLVMVSVLLDAGAGNDWTYTEPIENGKVYSRSEGLGIASLHMFQSGAFSLHCPTTSIAEGNDKDRTTPFRVDAKALVDLPDDAISIGFQANTTDNPLAGVQGRTQLLQRLGKCLMSRPEYFYNDEMKSYRPGNLVDFLWKHADSESNQVSINTLWEVMITGLGNMWPEGRTNLASVNMGDVWPHSMLPQDSESSKLVPFHKLSQWLQYSMIEPLEACGLKFTGLEAMTGLPEYRNGGLLIDCGVLVPKNPETLVKAFDPSSEVIVEWRALTVALMDTLYQAWKEKYNLTSEDFPLVKLLQAGTWTAGRVIAKSKRGGPPPISIISDGTLF